MKFVSNLTRIRRQKRDVYSTAKYAMTQMKNTMTVDLLAWNQPVIKIWDLSDVLICARQVATAKTAMFVMISLQESSQDQPRNVFSRRIAANVQSMSFSASWFRYVRRLAIPSINLAILRWDLLVSFIIFWPCLVATLLKSSVCFYRKMHLPERIIRETSDKNSKCIKVEDCPSDYDYYYDYDY